MIEQIPDPVPKYPLKPSIDTIIDDLYDVCDTFWTFRMLGDQNWALKATCAHGEFHRSSDSILHFTQAMVELYEIIVKHHDEQGDNYNE